MSEHRLLAVRRSVLLFVLGTLLISAPPSANAQDAPTFTEDTLLSLEIERIPDAGIQIELRNPADEKAKVSARLITEPRGLLRLAKRKLSIPPRGVASFVIERGILPDDQIPAGTYVGTLIVQSKSGVLFRSLQVSVGKPTVSELTMTILRGVIIWSGGDHRSQDLPLPPDTPRERYDLDAGTIVGTVRRDKGGDLKVVTVGYQRDCDCVPDLRLDVTGLLVPGTYKGTIDITPGDGVIDRLPITVVITDFILWPILALLAGVLTALGLQRWIGVGSTLKSYEGDIKKLRAKIQRARATFDAAIAGHAITVGSDVTALLECCAKKIEVDRRRLYRSTFASLGDSDDKALRANLDSLEAQIELFEKLGPLLVELDDSLDAVEGVAVSKDAPLEPPNYQGHRPGFIAKTRALLAARIPTNRCDLTLLPTYRDRVVKATMFAKAWPEWIGELESAREIAERLANLTALTDKEREKLAEALGLLSEAEFEMWYAKSVEDIEAKTSERDLGSATHLLAQLYHHLPREEARVILLDVDEATLRTFNAPSHSAEASQPSATILGQDLVRQAEWIAVQRHLWNGVAFWFLIAVAVWAGLGALYFGNAFGTLKDYVSVFFWGLATKTALDVVASGLQSLRRVRAA